LKGKTISKGAEGGGERANGTVRNLWAGLALKGSEG